MINISIWKWEYYYEDDVMDIIFDDDFKTPHLINNDNYVALSWETRNTMMSDKIMSEIFEWEFDGKLFKITDIIEELRKVEMKDNSELYQWIIVWSEESLKRYWDRAYIKT